MKTCINIGTNLLNKEKLCIDFEKLVNPHILIIGASGSGKSHLIKYLIEKIPSQYPINRIYVIDGQGDLGTPNTSSVIFTETSNIGINPLKLSSDPMFGGIRKKVSHFINAINKTSHKLGNRQRAVLRNLLFDLYAANGFFQDNPETWKLDENSSYYRKKYPNVEDLLRFTYSKIIDKMFGMKRESIRYFEELRKLSRKKSNILRKKATFNKNTLKVMIEEIDDEIKKIKEQMKEACQKGIEVSTGGEIQDILKYDNDVVLMSVYDVLENLFSVGFFKGKEVKFDETKKIWRYDIQTLNIDEQKLFVDFLADEIFQKNRETGLKDRVYEYLVVDEARKFIDLKKEDEILRIIGREARKYGLGQILASQELEHIPNDIITNSAIKIILGVDESNVNSISNKLNIKKEFLFKIQPHKTALINIKTLNSKKDFYIPVKLYE